MTINVAYLVVGFLLAAIGIGSARAADDTHPTAPEAYQHCQQASEVLADSAIAAWGDPTRNKVIACQPWSNGVSNGFTEHYSFEGQRFGNWYPQSGNGWTHTYIAQCADSAHEYDSATHTCKLDCPNGAQEDPLHPGTCLDDDKCKARNPGLGIEPAIRTWTQRCVAGCNLVMDSPTTTTAGGETFSTGTLRYTGTCATNDPSDPKGPTNESPDSKPSPEPDKCVPVGGGQTFCRKPNGEDCATASTGRQVCWPPNDTKTEKPDGDTIQKKCQGTTCPDFPDTPPPPNDTFTKGTSTTITNTTTNGTSNVTYTNYYTGTGGPAGNTNEGCGSDGTQGCTGTGSNGGGEGDDDKDKGNEVSGGDCPGVYTCSGGDASLCAILKEEHDQRCRGEKNDADTIEFANSHPMEGDEPPSPWGDDGNGGGVSLDEGGFGFGRTCPEPPSFELGGETHTIDIDGACTLAGMIGVIILMAAFVQAAYIIGGD